MELKERAELIIDSARDRAEALEEHDPQSASGMRSAADQAEERELGRDMEQAGGAYRAESHAAGLDLRSSAPWRRSSACWSRCRRPERAKAREQLLRQLESLIESNHPTHPPSRRTN